MIQFGAKFAAALFGVFVGASVPWLAVRVYPHEKIDSRALAHRQEQLHGEIEAQRGRITTLTREFEELNRRAASAQPIFERPVAELVDERDAAREDAKLHATIAGELLNRSEASQNPPPSGTPVTTASVAFVYFGNCGAKGWLSVNFENPPPCRSGDIVVLQKYVRGRAIRARRNLTLRSDLPSESGGLGAALSSYLPAGGDAKIVEVYPMSTISGPPILYWAKIEAVSAAE